MNTAFRYNRQGRGAERPPRGFGRWLSFWLGALARLPCGNCAGLLWIRDEAAALPAAGFPALLAVPERLFARTAAFFPERARLGTEGTEEELLARIRLIERRFGLRFDWDAFLAACEKQNRRARLLRAGAERLSALAPREIDARTPAAALRDLTERKPS